MRRRYPHYEHSHTLWWLPFIERLEIYDITNYLPWQVTPDDYLEITGRIIPSVTMGMEIEQPPDNLHEDFMDKMERLRGGHYDASDPFEWAYGPYTSPAQMLRLLYKDTEGGKYWWPWDNGYEFDWEVRSCGSHWHFAVNPGFPDYDKLIHEYWALCWNTLITLTYIFAPFMLWDGYGRELAERYAYPFYDRYSPSRVRELFSRRFERSTEDFITWNPASGSKPITIEVRLPETHPVFAATCQRLLSRAIRDVFNRARRIIPARGWIDIAPRPTRDCAYLLEEMGRTCWVMRRKSIYEVMEETGPIIFMPGGEIPETLLPISRYRARSYSNVWDLLKKILYCMMMEYDEKRRFSDYYWRCLWFIYHKGIPRDEDWRTIWRCYVDRDFQWDTIKPYKGRIPKPEEID